MRKLRIVGVDAESSQVECEDRNSGEKYSLPLDDRLRAAARGEFIAAGGADRPPVTGTLRPREIQDRIRHGASAEQVASDAGVPLSRIEGFAVPVLLERANAADMARNAHPVMADGPSLDTLGDKASVALDTWGIDLDLVKWDAWRERGNGWVVCISWPAGLSDDARANWSFIPDSHGGSARPLNEEAERILDPSRATGLRTVAVQPEQPAGPPPIRSVPTLAPAHADRSDTSRSDVSHSDASRPDVSRPHAVPAPAAPSAPPAAPPAPAPAAPAAPAASTPAAVPPAAITQPGSPAVGRQDSGRADSERPASQGTRRRSSGLPAALGGIDAALPSSAGNPGSKTPAQAAGNPTDQASGSTRGKAGEKTEEDDFLQPTPNEPERKPSSRRHPTMPSWEDVLLGVRSKDD